MFWLFGVAISALPMTGGNIGTGIAPSHTTLKAKPSPYLCRATWIFPPMPLVVDMCLCPVRGCRSPGTSTRWTWMLGIRSSSCRS